MKIFAGGIATETNTFCPILTSSDDYMVQRGRDALAGRIQFPGLDLSKTWGKRAKEGGHEFVFGLMAYAQPSGVTVKSVYESFRDELLAELKAALPVDIVLLRLHGAMVADGYDDCEEDLIHHVRRLVGPDTVVGAELDLHCHLRSSTISAADLVITFKEYPHVDINDRGDELFDLAVRTKRREIRPVMALFDCQMVGLYPTSAEPMRGFVDAMMAAEKRPKMLSLSLGHGFQFADVPHVGAKVLAITDNDPKLAAQVAREFGERVYRMRDRIGFESVSLPLDKALSQALAAKKWPVVVADQSDNAGGGAPGDSTFALRWLLEHKAQEVAMAIFYDPEVVRIAKKAGVGATLPVRLGGKLGPTSGDPLDLEVTVLSIRENYMHEFPQLSGEPTRHAIGDAVALRTQGIELIVASRRCQCYSKSIFEDFGIDLKAKRILIPKSSQHFYGSFAPIASEVIYMSAPGAVPPDPRQVTYRRMDSGRLYPWTKDPLGLA